MERTSYAGDFQKARASAGRRTLTMSGYPRRPGSGAGV